VCRACPFAAYRSPYGDYEGFCLMPDHYAALQAKGKAAYEEAEAARQQDAPAALPGAAPIGSSGYTPVEKTAAQKGQETRQRRLAQKADYTPNLLAVRRVVDLIATVEAHDLATLAAYTLAHVSLHKEDWAEIARRHGVDAGALMRAGGSAHPRGAHHRAAHARPARPRQGHRRGAADPTGASGARLRARQPLQHRPRSGLQALHRRSNQRAAHAPRSLLPAPKWCRGHRAGGRDGYGTNPGPRRRLTAPAHAGLPPRSPAPLHDR